MNVPEADNPSLRYFPQGDHWNALRGEATRMGRMKVGGRLEFRSSVAGTTLTFNAAGTADAQYRDTATDLAAGPAVYSYAQADLSPRAWETDEHNTLALLVDGGGLLRRVTIAHNDAIPIAARPRRRQGRGCRGEVGPHQRPSLSATSRSALANAFFKRRTLRAMYHSGPRGAARWAARRAFFRDFSQLLASCSTPVPSIRRRSLRVAAFFVGRSSGVFRQSPSGPRGGAVCFVVRAGRVAAVSL